MFVLFCVRQIQTKKSRLSCPFSVDPVVYYLISLTRGRSHAQWTQTTWPIEYPTDCVISACWIKNKHMGWFAFLEGTGIKWEDFPPSYSLFSFVYTRSLQSHVLLGSHNKVYPWSNVIDSFICINPIAFLTLSPHLWDSLWNLRVSVSSEQPQQKDNGQLQSSWETIPHFNESPVSPASGKCSTWLYLWNNYTVTIKGSCF